MVQTWVARPESSKGVGAGDTPFEDSGRATRKRAFLNHASTSAVLVVQNSVPIRLARIQDFFVFRGRF
jgi:hypothetical protein